MLNQGNKRLSSIQHWKQNDGACLNQKSVIFVSIQHFLVFFLLNFWHFSVYVIDLKTFRINQALFLYLWKNLNIFVLFFFLQFIINNCKHQNCLWLLLLEKCQKIFLYKSYFTKIYLKMSFHINLLKWNLFIKFCLEWLDFVQ